MDGRIGDMTAAETDAWESLLVTSQLLSAALDLRLGHDTDLSLFEFRTLAAIHCAPFGVVRIKQLAKLMTSTLPRMSKALSRMEARGLVRRARCEGDARATNVQLTEAGRATVDRATPAYVEEARRLLLGQFTESQLIELAGLLGPAAARLSGSDVCHCGADDDTLKSLLDAARTIAIVGLSADPEKPSGAVARVLIDAGYDVIPVNPYATEILGRKVYPTLAEIPVPIDIVDVFRPVREAAQIAREAVAIGASTLWLQLGITSDEARTIAEGAGLDFVEDSCIGATTVRLGNTALGITEKGTT